MSQITIVWTASPAPVDGYNVYRGIDPLTPPAFDNTVGYNSGAFITASGIFYRSLSDNNANHAPSSSPAFWSVVPAFDNGATFAANDVVFANGNLYASMSNGNVGNTPASSPASWRVQTSNISNEVGPALNGGTPVVGVTFTDSTVVSGQDYSYVVRATRGGIESLNSLDVFSPAVPFPASPAPLTLGAAASFGILASSTITNVPGTPTVVSGDVGLSPGTSITGMGTPVTISGVFHINDFVSAAAQSALASAIATAVGLPGAVTVPADLGGMVLTPGVYNNASSIAITGTLVLDAGGNPNAVFIIRAGSTLTTAVNNSNVHLAGGAQAANVFWIVGSSATLNGGTSFSGNILAQVSITVNHLVYVTGRLMAHTGAVTLDDDNVWLMQACADQSPLPPSVPNAPPAPPVAPTGLNITSES